MLRYTGITLKNIDNDLQKRNVCDVKTTHNARDIHSELLFNVLPDRCDQVIVFYVSGYCARSLVNSKKCEHCKETLVADSLKYCLEFEVETVPKEAVEFLEEISRGGLWVPQDHLYRLGILCWQIFSEIKKTTELRFWEILIKRNCY